MQLKYSLVFILNFIVDLSIAGSDQRRLLKYLFSEKSYDPLERPVFNDTESVSVTINLALQQIVDYDGKNEVITLSGWMVMNWRDYSLTWNPQEYGNIETLRLPSAQIWTPDILLYSSADEKFDSTIRVNAVVQHTGDILYAPPVINVSVDLNNYLHKTINFTSVSDTQTCVLKFGSWTFDDTGINLTAESNKGQIDAYIPNAEWDLLDFTVSGHALKYDCCPTLYPYVLFTIRIHRRPLYYLSNIIIPCFLISVLTLLGFLLAPDSGEKLTLQITILLSVVMFSLVLSEILPPSSNAVPIISLYFLCVMCMSTLSVVASVLVISIHFRNAKNYDIPSWIQKYICHYLAFFLRMSRPRHDLTWQGIRRKWAKPSKIVDRIELNNDENRLKSLSVPLLNRSDDSRLSVSAKCGLTDSVTELVEESVATKCRPVTQTEMSNPSPHTSMNSIRSDLRLIINHLSVMTQHAQSQSTFDDESQDWKFVAMVIDRLCLIIFTLSMIGFTVYTYLQIPRIQRVS